MNDSATTFRDGRLSPVSTKCRNASSLARWAINFQAASGCSVPEYMLCPAEATRVVRVSPGSTGKWCDVPLKLSGQDVGEYGELREHADSTGYKQISRGKTAHFNAGNMDARFVVPISNELNLFYGRVFIHGVCTTIFAQDIATFLPHFDPGVAVQVESQPRHRFSLRPRQRSGRRPHSQNRPKSSHR